MTLIDFPTLEMCNMLSLERYGGHSFGPLLMDDYSRELAKWKINAKKKLYITVILILGFPGSSDSKASAYNAGNLGSIPGSGRSPGEGKGNPLQYSCLENPMDWGAWWATVHGVTKSRTRLSDFTSLHLYQSHLRGKIPWDQPNFY